jgi:hypothetical protein
LHSAAVALASAPVPPVLLALSGFYCEARSKSDSIWFNARQFARKLRHYGAK